MNRKKSLAISTKQSAMVTPVCLSPQHKTQLILKPSNKQNTKSLSTTKSITLKTQQTKKEDSLYDMRLKYETLAEMYKELQQKYDISKDEIQKCQVTIEKLNQRRAYEKQQYLAQLASLKKSQTQRSRSVLDNNSENICNIVGIENNQTILIKELNELREKNKKFKEVIDTKNNLLDYLTKKLINYQNSSDLVTYIKDLNDKLRDRDEKLKEYEHESKSKYVFSSIEILNHSKDQSLSSNNIISVFFTQNQITNGYDQQQNLEQTKKSQNYMHL